VPRHRRHHARGNDHAHTGSRAPPGPPLARRLDGADTMVELLMHPDPRARVLLGIKAKLDMTGPMTLQNIADGAGATLEDVTEVASRLRRLKLAQVGEDSVLRITDQGRFFEFLEFVESPQSPQQAKPAPKPEGPERFTSSVPRRGDPEAPDLRVRAGRQARHRCGLAHQRHVPRGPVRARGRAGQPRAPRPHPRSRHHRRQPSAARLAAAARHRHQVDAWCLA